MSRYDDDRVIALLRDAVPPVPEAADRVVSIRARAGRQRALLWTQTLGAVASVLLVVGVAAAVSGSGGEQGDLRPLDEPVAALADALSRERSVRFEASMTPVGGSGGDQLETHATGAATRDGDVLLKGDLSFMSLFGEDGDAERELRYVDGRTYVSILPSDAAPAGKKWLRSGDGEPPGGVAVITELLRNVDSLATDVRHLRTTTVRGEPVAEYRLTIPARYANGEAVDVTFALDARRRLRRAYAEFSWRRVMGGGEIGYEESSSMSVAVPPVAVATPRVRMSPSDGPQPTKVWLNPTAEPSYEVMPPIPTPVPPDDPMTVRLEIELFGYGDDVRIVAPPAAEVLDENDYYEGSADGPSAALQACMEQAHDEESARRCMNEHTDLGGMGGYPSDDCASTPMPDGSETVTCEGSRTGSVGSVSRSGTLMPTGVASPPPAP